MNVWSAMTEIKGMWSYASATVIHIDGSITESAADCADARAGRKLHKKRLVHKKLLVHKKYGLSYLKKTMWDMVQF